MGMATFRLSASCASEVVFGSVVSDPLVGPAVFTEAGQRPFVDITPVLRSQIGRALVPRVLDVMKARSAVALRGLGEDPRPAQRSYTSRWPFVRRLLAVAVHFRIPLQIAQALLNPAAARRRRAPTVGLGSCDTSPAWRGPRTWSGCGNMCSARIARASR